MPGFFDQPVSGVVPNPEPPETTLIRDLLARKTFDLQADPYAGNTMRSNSLNPAPAFGGSGGGPSNEFFYGQQGQNGGQPPRPNIPTAPREDPRQIGRQRPPTRVVQRGGQSGGSQIPEGLGGLFEALQLRRPNKDPRMGLKALLQSLMRSRGPQEEPAHDGDAPSADLPGFDGVQTGSSGGADWTNPQYGQDLWNRFGQAASQHGIASGRDAGTGFATLTMPNGWNARAGNPGLGVGRGSNSFAFSGHGAPAAGADLRDYFMQAGGMQRGNARSAANQITSAGRAAAQNDWIRQTHNPADGWRAPKHSITGRR